MKKLPTVKIRGSQGSWEATVSYPDGRKETLACVHHYFWKNSPTGARYEDPWTPELRTTEKFARHIQLIQDKGEVILTSDKVDESRARGGGFFERDGYIGIYKIENFVLDEEGMRFDIVERLANAE